jgi:hypothetical protein
MNTQSEPQDPREAEAPFVRWAPLGVPLTAGILVAMIALVWWSVL